MREVHPFINFDLQRYIGTPTRFRTPDGRRIGSGIMARRQAQHDREHPPRVIRPAPLTPREGGAASFGGWQAHKQATNWIGSRSIHERT